MSVKFRTAYDDNYVSPGYQRFDKDGVPLDAQGNPEPSLTVQSERDNCDINVIIDRFEKTGVLPVMSQQAIGDVDLYDAPTYQESLNVVIAAQNAFDALPAKIRKEFDNDPAKFLAFVDNPENGDRMIELGLREAPPAPPAQTKKDDGSAAS